MPEVKIYGPLGFDLDKSKFNSYLTVKLESGDNTLADVIDQLTARYGVKVKEELLDAEGNLDHAYGIFNDGERVPGLSAQVEDDAELVVVVMLGGG